MSQDNLRVPIAQLYLIDGGLQVISNTTHQKEYILLIGDILTLEFPEVKKRIEITWKQFDKKPDTQGAMSPTDMPNATLDEIADELDKLKVGWIQESSGQMMQFVVISDIALKQISQRLREFAMSYDEMKPGGE